MISDRDVICNAYYAPQYLYEPINQYGFVAHFYTILFDAEIEEYESVRNEKMVKHYADYSERWYEFLEYYLEHGPDEYDTVEIRKQNEEFADE